MKTRYKIIYTAIIILTVLTGFLSLAAGSVKYTLPEIISALSADDKSTAYVVIMSIRFPRFLTALLLGGALSLSGMLMQCYFANPIAGPFVLGVSSGARLTVALLSMTAISLGFSPHPFYMIFSAFMGAMLSLFCVLLIGRKAENGGTLIIAGVMIGYICQAVTEFVTTFADDQGIASLHAWSKGSFAGSDMRTVRITAPMVLICAIAVFMLSKPLGAYLLGESYAKSAGVDVKLFRTALILLSGLLAAVVTAFAGPVSFVGVAVPHIAKRLLGTEKPIILIPAVFLCGGLFCSLCDLAARTAFAPVELGISSVTAVFGAPVVIWVMLRRKTKV